MISLQKITFLKKLKKRDNLFVAWSKYSVVLSE